MQDGIVYAHFKEESGGMAVTAACGKKEGWLRVAFAWCSPKDQFCRKRGRLIAKGRLLKDSGESAFEKEDWKQAVTGAATRLEHFLDANCCPRPFRGAKVARGSDGGYVLRRGHGQGV